MIYKTQKYIAVYQLLKKSKSIPLICDMHSSINGKGSKSQNTVADIMIATRMCATDQILYFSTQNKIGNRTNT